MRKFNFRVSDALHAQASQRAEAEGITLAELMRRSHEAWLKEPPKEVPRERIKRTRRASFSIDPRDMAVAKDHARRTGLSLSAYIRSLLDGHKPTSRSKVVKGQTVERLQDVGNRVNLLAKQLNASAYDGRTPDIEELAQALRATKAVVQTMRRDYDKALDDNPEMRAQAEESERRQERERLLRLEEGTKVRSHEARA